ncbi:hypothetical protein DFJ74DRAFT_449763 [Hyaloraphidium curvatum]|nr:hypothetical protein DFJ74DRAFT_449763 [Hyaloraphidium curvatum]
MVTANFRPEIAPKACFRSFGTRTEQSGEWQQGAVNTHTCPFLLSTGGVLSSVEYCHTECTCTVLLPQAKQGFRTADPGFPPASGFTASARAGRAKSVSATNTVAILMGCNSDSWGARSDSANQGAAIVGRMRRRGFGRGSHREAPRFRASPPGPAMGGPGPFRGRKSRPGPMRNLRSRSRAAPGRGSATRRACAARLFREGGAILEPRPSCRNQFSRPRSEI